MRSVTNKPIELLKPFLLKQTSIKPECCDTLHHTGRIKLDGTKEKNKSKPNQARLLGNKKHLANLNKRKPKLTTVNFPSQETKVHVAVPSDLGS